MENRVRGKVSRLRPGGQDNRQDTLEGKMTGRTLSAYTPEDRTTGRTRCLHPGG